MFKAMKITKDRRRLQSMPRGVLPNFQYSGIQRFNTTFNTTFNTPSMPIFGVRKFTLNQCLGSVNYNMDQNSTYIYLQYLGSTNMKKGRIVEFVLH